MVSRRFLRSAGVVIALAVVSVGTGCAAPRTEMPSASPATETASPGAEEAPGVAGEDDPGSLDDPLASPDETRTSARTAPAVSSPTAADSVPSTQASQPTGAGDRDEVRATDEDRDAARDVAVRIATLAFQVDDWWLPRKGNVGRTVPVTAQQVVHLGAWMAEPTRRVWEDSLASAQRPAQVAAAVRGLALVPWRVPGVWVHAPVRDVVVTEPAAVRAGTAPESGADMVEVSFTISGTAAYVGIDRAVMVVPVIRRVVYVLERGSGVRPWLLRDWVASDPTVGEPHVATPEDGWFALGSPVMTATPDPSPTVFPSPRPTGRKPAKNAPDPSSSATPSREPARAEAADTSPQEQSGH